MFGDQTIRSTINFRELPRQHGAELQPHIQIQLLASRQPENHLWLHEWKESDDTITLSVASHQAGFLLRFPELCDFILDTKQRCIQIAPHDEIDEHTIEHLLVDQVLPRLLAHEGNLLLHACALNVQGRTVLFLGKSGWGKSTVAGLFHQGGYQLYSDDCVLLRQQGTAWQALATYPSLRLYEDSISNIFTGDSALSPVSEYSDKQRIALTLEHENSIPPLHAMYLLSDPEVATNEILITSMQPGNTCIELIQRSFRLDLGNAGQSRTLMAFAAALTKSVPAYRLSYPHDFENNHLLLARLIQHIQE